MFIEPTEGKVVLLESFANSISAHLAKNQLETLDQTLQDSGLHAWEPDLALEVLHLLHSCCELLPQNHAVRERKEEIYRRLCHLDLEVVLE